MANEENEDQEQTRNPMPAEVFQQGDRVQVVNAPDFPWPELDGVEGNVIYVPDASDEYDPNIIVEFEEGSAPGHSGITSRAHHFKKVD